MNIEDFENYFASDCTLGKDNIILRGYIAAIFRQSVISWQKLFRNIQKIMKFYIVRNGRPVIGGREFMSNFNMGTKSINAIAAGSDGLVKSIINRYSNSVFREKLGHYKYAKISLQLKPDARPVLCKLRNVPFAFEAEMNKELQRLVDQGILEPVDSSKWGPPLVAVLKSDGRIRNCGDY